MYAPIVVFVYNRVEHAKGVLSSLAKCPEAKDSMLYIFSDGPKNEKAVSAVQTVREYIRSEEVQGSFGEVRVVESPKNKGLANSVISGVDQVIREHKRVIVVEDDNVVAVDFLDFMNRALDFYEGDSRIWSVGGYTLPINIPKDYKHDVFLMGRGSSYAWATWLDRWETIDWKIRDYAEFKGNKKLRKAFNEFGDDAAYMLDSQMAGRIDSWAIRFLYNAFKQNKKFILPTKSRVKNTGNDGSGIHVSSTDTRFDTELATEVSPAVFESVSTVDKRLKKEFQKVFNVPFSVKCKRYVKALLKR